MKNNLMICSIAAISIFSTTTVISSASAAVEVSPSQEFSLSQSTPGGSITYTAADPSVIKEIEKSSPDFSQSPTPDLVSSIRPPDNGSDSYTKVVCNKSYQWKDSLGGSIFYQHKCGSSVSPWGIAVPPSMVAAATNSAKEVGMQWTTYPNGKKGKGAPHTEWPSYLFHGTFNPLKGGDSVQFYDRITFNMRYPNGRIGPMTVTAQGNLWQSN